jgi:hypothetical protein
MTVARVETRIGERIDTNGSAWESANSFLCTMFKVGRPF